MDEKPNDEKGTRMSKSRDQSNNNFFIKGNPHLCFLRAVCSTHNPKTYPPATAKHRLALLSSIITVISFFQSNSSLKLTTGAQIL